jgi:heme-degrading monooxygenase HmoA
LRIKQILFICALISIKNVLKMIAKTPAPPYYAVIFTSTRLEDNGEAYGKTAARMVELAQTMDGFLGVESAREDVGITVSYWASLAAIRNWKYQTQHVEARDNGRELWYKNFKTRICLVERDYGFEKL